MSSTESPQRRPSGEAETEPATAESPYVVDEASPQRADTARFETKPSPVNYTGGGYEHWRSHEYRPHTPGDTGEDAYVSHHRLLAVVACYPVEMPLSDVLDDLRGKDIHHESGVPWDNRPENLTAISHGRHSEITQRQRRAWAEDEKRQVEEAESRPQTGEQKHCDRCGEWSDGLAECAAWPDEKRCIECATETANGHEIIL